ncbi:MAG: DsrE family protein [Nitrospinota bacterium]|nr:DsrE family protein [Nitrospinota bacterium]
MTQKRVTLVVNCPPNFYTAEKLRMAVGMTLEDGNRISILFIDDGTYSVNGVDMGKNPSNMEINKSLETLGMLGVKLYSHSPSMKKTGMEVEKYNVLPLDERGAADMLDESDVIIS